MNINQLFEQILREGSKKRFIEPVWGKLDPSNVYSLLTAFDPAIGGDVNDIPNSETMTKWVDSGAADKFLPKGWNWQTLGKATIENFPAYIYLIDAYLKYKSAGGSRAEKKEISRKDPNELFKNSGLKVSYEGEDNSNSDLVILKSLENEKFVFVVPMNWKANQWLDSFDCGGQGAQWCIGYVKEETYWTEHTADGELFIMAYSKNPNPKMNELKYMITLSPRVEDTQAWKQPDDPKDTIPLCRFQKFFGYDPNQLFKVFDKNFFGFKNRYSDNMDNWFGFEGYSKNDLTDKVIYYSDIMSYTSEQMEDIINKVNEEMELNVDFEGKEVDPKLCHAGDGEVFDVAEFINYFQSIGCKFKFGAELINGKFKEVFFDASEELPKVWISKSKIGKLNYNPYDEPSALVVGHDSYVDELHFYCSPDNPDLSQSRLQVDNVNKETYEENEMEEFNESKKLKEGNDSNFIFSKTINDLIEDGVEQFEFTVFGKENVIELQGPELKRIYYIIPDEGQICLINEEYWSEPLYQVIEEVIGMDIEYNDLQAKEVSNRVRESQEEVFKGILNESKEE